LKLKSVLKGAKEKFQIINPNKKDQTSNIIEKLKEKRPKSSGAVRINTSSNNILKNNILNTNDNP